MMVLSSSPQPMYLYNNLGQPIKTDNIQFVDHVVSLKQKSGSNPWPVIEKLISYWANQSPSRYQSFLINISDTKATRRDKKFASSKEQSLRWTLDVPQEVISMIRCLYNADELPMTKEFFREFAGRFPAFKVAEKI